MTIFIAPIGVKTDHVKGWLKEESRDVTTLWLIHSKKSPKYDFPKLAKKLEKDLKLSYPQIEIKKAILENAFREDPTIDAILTIILDEEKHDPSLLRNEFVVNITGGTNAVAAGAVLAATFYGTRAQYVLEPQKGDSRKTKYVYELPIRPIGIANMNQNQLDVLKIIAESTYEIEDTPKNLDSHKTDGCITRNKLLEKLGWDKKDENSSRKLGATKLTAIATKLKASGNIEQINFIETYVDKNFDKKEITNISHGYTSKTKNKKHRANWEIVKNTNEVRYVVTTVGKRQARDSLMFNI